MPLCQTVTAFGNHACAKHRTAHLFTAPSTSKAWRDSWEPSSWAFQTRVPLEMPLSVRSAAEPCADARTHRTLREDEEGVCNGAAAAAPYTGSQRHSGRELYSAFMQTPVQQRIQALSEWFSVVTAGQSGTPPWASGLILAFREMLQISVNVMSRSASRNYSQVQADNSGRELKERTPMQVTSRRGGPAISQLQPRPDTRSALPKRSCVCLCTSKHVQCMCSILCHHAEW